MGVPLSCIKSNKSQTNELLFDFDSSLDSSTLSSDDSNIVYRLKKIKTYCFEEEVANGCLIVTMNLNLADSISIQTQEYDKIHIKPNIKLDFSLLCSTIQFFQFLKKCNEKDLKTIEFTDFDFSKTDKEFVKILEIIFLLDLKNIIFSRCSFPNFDNQDECPSLPLKMHPVESIFHKFKSCDNIICRLSSIELQSISFVECNLDAKDLPTIACIVNAVGRLSFLDLSKNNFSKCDVDEILKLFCKVRYITVFDNKINLKSSNCTSYIEKRRKRLRKSQY